MAQKPPKLTSFFPLRFAELVAALNTLEKIAWVRLDDDTARFTVIPDTGSQVWAFVAPLPFTACLIIIIVIIIIIIISSLF